MVLLLSALAVIAAAVLLVAWFVVGGGFGLIYAAMALAVVSMLLLWAARWIGSTPAPDGALAPAPLAEDLRVEIPVRGEVDPGSARPFPIADYEHLWVTQVLPLLPQLDDDELAMVEARERGSRNRRGIVDAVRAEREARAGLAQEDDAEDAAAEADDEVDLTLAPEPESDRDVEPLALAPEPTAAGDEDPVGDADAEGEDEAEAAAFERAWNQLTAIDDLEDLAQLDPPRRERSLFGRGWNLDDEDERPAARLDDEGEGASGGGDEADRSRDGEHDGEDPAPVDAERPVPAAEGVVDLVEEPAGSGPPRIRTFLGRASAPIRVERSS